MGSSRPKRWLEAEAERGDQDAARKLLAETTNVAVPSGARARVWARLSEAEPRRGSGVARFVAVSAAACAALVLILVLSRPTSRTGTGETVTVAEGRAVVVRSEESVDLRTESGAVVTIASGGRAVLSPGTAIRVPKAGAALGTIRLDSGSIDFTPFLAGAAPEVVIDAPPFTVVGRSASFRVTRLGRGDVAVGVGAGEVHVTGPGTDSRLSSGESRSFGVASSVSQVSPDAPPSVQAAPRSAAAAGPEPAVALDREPQPRAHSTKSARAENQPRSRAHSMEGSRAAKRRARSVARAEEEVDTKSSAAAGWPMARPEEAASERRTAAQDLALEPRRGPAENSSDVEVPGAPRLSVSKEPAAVDYEALYRRARKEANPWHAIRLFDRVAAEDNPFAEVSAHQAARLSMRLDRCDEAIARFERSLARSPSGTFAKEARLDILECRVRSGDSEAADAALEDYLARYPGSDKVPELRFLRAEIARKGGRCEEAIPDYRAAQTTGHADDATYFEAWCLLEGGDRAGGLAVLDRYLENFPNGRHAAEASRVRTRRPKP